VWDETIVLPMSGIGELAVFARRKGDAWFLAILNGPTARTVEIPCAFLGRGEYRALIVRDQPGDFAAVKVERSGAERKNVLKITLGSGGGFIARFVRTVN
jgi:alpha-glucosidase